MTARPSRARHALLLAGLAALALAGCQRDAAEPATPATPGTSPDPTAEYAAQHAGDYATVQLKADLSTFDADGKRMIALLVQASQVMDDIFWKQSWDGDREALLARAADPAT